MPIEPPRDSMTVLVVSMAMAAGTVRATPNPCAARNSISPRNEPAKMNASVAAAITISPSWIITFRRRSRSLRAPPSGCNTAAVMPYAAKRIPTRNGSFT